VLQNSIGGPKDSGPHMSSTTTARGHAFYRRCYAKSWRGNNCEDDASLLNYWGMSYGTSSDRFFAIYVSAPCGRVVLDGVLIRMRYQKNLG